MLNNLGATTAMELAIVARHAVPYLEAKGFRVERIYAGSFLTSLDMAGISISLLGVDDQRLRWLDAATAAPAWPNLPRQRPRRLQVQLNEDAKVATSAEVSSGNGAKSELGIKVSRAIESALSGIDQRRG